MQKETEFSKSILLSHYRIKLLHVVQWGFDTAQLLEENQREGQVDNVVVVESQATQDSKQEVTLLLYFRLRDKLIIRI